MFKTDGNRAERPFLAPRKGQARVTGVAANEDRPLSILLAATYVSYTLGSMTAVDGPNPAEIAEQEGSQAPSSGEAPIRRLFAVHLGDGCLETVEGALYRPTIGSGDPWQRPLNAGLL